MTNAATPVDVRCAHCGDVVKPEQAWGMAGKPCCSYRCTIKVGAAELRQLDRERVDDPR